MSLWLEFLDSNWTGVDLCALNLSVFCLVWPQQFCEKFFWNSPLWKIKTKHIKKKKKRNTTSLQTGELIQKLSSRQRMGERAGRGRRCINECVSIKAWIYRHVNFTSLWSECQRFPLTASWPNKNGSTVYDWLLTGTTVKVWQTAPAYLTQFFECACVRAYVPI